MNRFITLTLSLAFSLTALKSYSGNNDPFAFSSKGYSDIKMLSSSLFTAGGNIADGNRVVFDQQYSNAVDGNDAMKLMNPGENFGLVRDNHTLAVEARQPIAIGDTLFYYLGNLHSQLYRLEIAAQNLGSAIAHCELIDRYLNTRIPLSLTDSNHLLFEITADPASRASNRLIIVFSNTLPNNLPVQFTGITAGNVDKGVFLQWQVKHELDVQQYDIERSADADHFTTIATVAPMYENENGGAYQYNDIIVPASDNFYRIHAIDRNGVSTYSDKVKLPAPVLHTGIMNTYPNPVTDHHFQVNLNKMLPGRYTISLSNNFGQQVFTTSVQVAGNNFTQTIKLDANIGKGVYLVSVWSENGIVKTQKLIIQ